MINPTVDDYIEQLRRAYVAAWQRRRPNFNGLGEERARKAFLRIATVLCEHRVDPWSYMQFAFDSYTAREVSDILPNMVASQALVSAYIQTRPDRVAELQLTVQLLNNYVTDRLRRGHRLVEILDDPLAPLSAVFRFAAAWTAGETALAETFRREATQTLQFEPAYRSILWHMLPEEMRQ